MLPSGTNTDIFGVVVGHPQEKTALRVEQNTVYSENSYFKFAKLFQNTVKDVFNISLLPIIEDFVDGYNGVLFFITPSNKTSDELLAGNDAQKISFMSLMVEKMFDKIGKEIREAVSYDNQDTRAQVNLQMVEFTNDIIRDLLDTNNRPDLSESVDKGPFVMGTSECSVSSASEAVRELRTGWKNRTRQNVPAAQTATLPDTGAVMIQFELHRLRRQPGCEAGDSESQIRLHRSRLRLIYLPGCELLVPGSRSSISSPLPSLITYVGELAGNHPANVASDFSSNHLTAICRDEIAGNCRTVCVFCIPRNIEPKVLEVEIDACQKFGAIRTFPICNTDNAYHLQCIWRSIHQQFRQYLVGPVPGTGYQGSMVVSGGGSGRRRLARPGETGNRSGSSNSDVDGQGGGQGRQGGIFGPPGMAGSMGMGPMGGDPTKDIISDLKRFQAENVELRDRNEFLFNRIEELQNTYGYLSNAKTDMSTQLLLLEEEKLKASQGLVDMQMENNKLEEKLESIRFQLMNKILTLENQAVESEAKIEQLRKEVDHYKDLAGHLEIDKKELADEYVNLKQNYIQLTKEVEKLAKNNEQLAVELYNMAQSKAAIMREYFLTIGDADGGSGQISAELKRVADLIAALSGNKVKPEMLSSAKEERINLEKMIFSSHQRYKQEVEQLRREWNEQQLKWEDRLGQLRKELMDARKQLRDKQHEVSVVNASFISCRSERDSLQQQFNRLQHKLKDLNSEYQQRLISYINDIASYVDKGSGLPLADRQRAAAELRRYVKGMLTDLQKSHQTREEQLSKAAQEFRQRTLNMVRQHESLLIAYRYLRQQIADRGIEGIELGPDESSMILSDAELQSKQARENAKISDDLTRTKTELEKLRMKVKVMDAGGSFDSDGKGIHDGGVPYQSWPTLQRQLREFTLNTQKELEEERAKLVARCSVLEEQLREAQEYIDSHLVKYKDEILRLRRLLGYPEEEFCPPGSQLPGIAVPATFDTADRSLPRAYATPSTTKPSFYL